MITSVICGNIRALLSVHEDFSHAINSLESISKCLQMIPCPAGHFIMIRYYLCVYNDSIKVKMVRSHGQGNSARKMGVRI